MKETFWFIIGSPFFAPKWNTADLNEIWNTYGKESSRRPGTVGEARESLEECSRNMIHMGAEAWIATSDFRRKLEKYSEGTILGDVSRVSRLRKDKIPIGYTIEKSATGYSRETIEDQCHGFVMIRFRGVLIRARKEFIQRTEIGRGITYI